MLTRAHGQQDDLIKLLLIFQKQESSKLKISANITRERCFSIHPMILSDSNIHNIINVDG
jgi:hypothetical protein